MVKSKGSKKAVTKRPKKAVPETEAEISKTLTPYHCYGCGRMLCKENMIIGAIELKCERCGAINLLLSA